MNRTLIIAEAGVNHNGSLDRALALVDAAKAAGADVVKFQHFRAETIVAAGTRTAAYQQVNTGSIDQSDLLRALELDLAAFARIAAHCRDTGIAFLCTAFDMDIAADLIALGMTHVKIPSGELTNLPMLRAYARFGLPVLLSTGMGTMDEVAEAMRALEEAGATEITLLQCTSIYPAPPEAMNLRAMTAMARHFARPVGLSDHSLDDHAAIAAVAMGACVIEKHLTLDCGLPGPDHRASLEPPAFAAMVRRIRDVEIMLGDGIKQPTPTETDTARLVRRSWHAACAIAAGQTLEAADVMLLRPATGLPPAFNPIGATAAHEISAGQALRPDDLIP